MDHFKLMKFTKKSSLQQTPYLHSEPPSGNQQVWWIKIRRLGLFNTLNRKTSAGSSPPA